MCCGDGIFFDEPFHQTSVPTTEVKQLSSRLHGVPCGDSGDLTGCETLFVLDSYGPGENAGNAQFLSIGALNIVQELLTKADETKNDSCKVLDGYGRPLYLSGLKGYSDYYLHSFLEFDTNQDVKDTKHLLRPAA